jgi:hypothetical protein
MEQDELLTLSGFTPGVCGLCVLTLFDLLKSLYFDTKILSKYIPSLQKRL